MTDIPDFAQLSPDDKRALLTRLLEQDAEVSDRSLLPQQRRLWFLHHLDDSVPWHAVTGLRFHGKLDLAALQQALSAVAERHEVLRSLFTDVNGRPVRTVQPVLGIRMPIFDADESSASAIVRRESWKPFDLSSGPLLRTLVIRRAPDDHTVVLITHLLVADQTSLRLLTQEVLDGYAALMDGDTPQAGVAIGFAAEVAEQLAWLDGAEAERDTAYWRDRMSGLVPLKLPTIRQRPAAKTFHAVSATAPLGSELAGAVTALGTQLATDRSVPLLTAYATLLGRLAGQHDLAVGLPAESPDGVERPAVHADNMVPVRIDFSVSDTFQDCVRATANAVRGAFEHGRLPFDAIVSAAAPQRDTSTTPLFQFAFRQAPPTPEAVPVPDAHVELVSPETGFVAYDLELSVQWTATDAVLRIDGNADLFDEAELSRLLTRLTALLAGAVTAPDAALKSTALVTADERTAALTTWNDTHREHAREKCLHQLVTESAGAAPDTVAVRCGSDTLTYAQLDSRSDRVARRLRELGVGPEAPVAVAIQRSVEAVIGLLGVLKSGGAYVPVDPAYPSERVQYVLSDSGAVAVVGAEAALALVATSSGTLPHVAVPDDDQPSQALPEVVTPGNLAYVIYTSGSTGRPKGVAVEHRQIVASTAARRALETAGLPERYLVLAPLTFDAAGGGLYWTLSRGGTVVLPTEAEVRDPRLLGKLIRAAEVTHFDGVPSQYSVLLESAAAGMPSLRCCILAGEALPPALVGEHFAHNSHVQLINEYGPTETTVWATMSACGEQHAEAASVPIGRPIANSGAYVLDEHLNPVPPLTAGELCLAGEGVTRGYLGQAATTAERFVPHPFPRHAGERIYRTGDRARWLPDGQLEFLGRVDNQVKIRGFRVELAEVENVLLRHPAVAEAVVTVHESTPGHPRLVAYIVPVLGRALPKGEVRAHVLATLPDYMTPSAIISLERMPLTSHGKVDRAALPAPDDLSAAEGGVQPRTQTEIQVAEIVTDILGLPRVSVTADFFELGGNSLLVARLVARLARGFETELSVDQIFRVPTVEGISDALDTQQRIAEGRISGSELYEQRLGELRDEIKLDPSVSPEGLPVADYLRPQHILVTGATGYLGSFLVVELIKRSDAIVHCLVRAADEDAGWERLVASLSEFRTWDETLRARIRLVVGDLSKPLLGMDRERFDYLAETVDAIHHSGALVNFTYPYEALRTINVLGTEQLLYLACHRKLKAFHFVSTMDVFIGAGAVRPYMEEDLDDLPAQLPTGYPRSKWVSEKLVSLARDRGVPVCIYRPWLIVGHQTTGAAHRTDYLFVSLKGFLELGILPSYNDVVNAVPVDYAAAAIAHISLQEESFGKYFNVGNLYPANMLKIYEWLDSFGYGMPVVEYEQAVNQAMEVGQDHALYPITPVIRTAPESHPMLRPEMYEAIDSSLECRNAIKALQGTGIECPPITEEFAHRCLEFMVEIGYLPAPERDGDVEGHEHAGV